MPEHTASYYAACLPPRAPFADAFPAGGLDVLVLGGGLAGLSTAHELARRGLAVGLCETNRVGWGASGRNGGFVLPGYAEGMASLTRQLGADHARELHRMSCEGVDFVRERIEAANRPDLIHGKGGLELYRHPLSDGEISAELEEHAGLGTPVTHLDRAGLAQHVRTARYHHGFLSRHGFHIDPLGYVELLAEQARAAGARIREMSPVHDVRATRDGHEVTTGDGQFRARHVVFAGSAYMDGVNSTLRRAVLPVATYMVASQPIRERLDGAILFTGCLSDTRRAGDYYRRTRDHRLLWGGRITTRISQPDRLTRIMRRDIASVYPQLADIGISHTWSGLMGYAVHKMPLIASLDKGLWVATGFGGHGLNTTAIAGRVVAEAISGESDRIRLFSPFRARWGGGIVGRLATQAIYWRLRMQDARDERRAGPV